MMSSLFWGSAMALFNIEHRKTHENFLNHALSTTNSLHKQLESGNALNVSNFYPLDFKNCIVFWHILDFLLMILISGYKRGSSITVQHGAVICHVQSVFPQGFRSRLRPLRTSGEMNLWRRCPSTTMLSDLSPMTWK